MVRAVFTLTMFSVLERALGFGFKIYLSRELGAAALGIYQVALSFFFVLVTLVTSGVPLISAKLTARFRAEKDYRSEFSVTAAALTVNVAVSAVVCLVVFAVRDRVGALFADSLSMSLLLVMLPAVVLSGVYASFRGVLWGRKLYTAVSVVEIVEQISRIAVTVALFSLGFDKLRTTAFAMTLGCAVSCLACVAYYFCKKGRLADPRPVLKPLLRSSAPITMVRASSSVLNSLVALAVPFLLSLNGATNEEALYTYGASVGMAMPLLYIPITVVGSLAFVMIPTLSAAVANKDTADVHRQVSAAISFAIYVAALFVPMFYALGEPIGQLVYDNVDSGRFLSAASWLLIPIAVENITSSMMNSLDLERTSFINYAIGSAVLFAILFAFCKKFDINVYAWATGISLTLSGILDIAAIRRKTKVKLDFVWALVKSILLIIPAIVLNRAFYLGFRFLPPLLRTGCTCLISLLFMFGLNYLFGTFDISLVVSRKRRAKPGTERKDGMSERRARHDARPHGRAGTDVKPSPGTRPKRTSQTARAAVGDAAAGSAAGGDKAHKRGGPFSRRRSPRTAGRP